MRLIDADDVQKKLVDAIDWLRKEDYGTYSAVVDDIVFVLDKQPTTFDVNKVVDELESFAKLAEERYKNNTNSHAYQEYKCWMKAIKIVKRGGIE